MNKHIAFTDVPSLIVEICIVPISVEITSLQIQRSWMYARKGMRLIKGNLFLGKYSWLLFYREFDDKIATTPISICLV